MKASKLMQGMILSILLGLTLMPFYMLLISSFKNKEQMIHHFWGLTLPLQLGNYTSAYSQIAPFILNSVIVSTGIAVGVVFISSMAAYSFIRFVYPGKEFMFLLILSLLMIPGFLTLIPQFLMIKNLGLLNSYLGQILPPTAYGAAMATFLMRAFFQNLPNSLLESAEVEGAGELRIFFGIVIPLSTPVIATVTIINFLAGWNNYIWPLVSTTGTKVKPVILALNTISGSVDQGISVKLAGFVIASLPLILLFIVATKPFISGITSGAVKG
jgi:ABC-type glycerol-3-phosphate transport system permease component